MWYMACRARSQPAVAVTIKPPGVDYANVVTPPERVTRGTTNRNARGGAPARRRRRQWLLDQFGDGKTAPCSFGCGTAIDIDTMTVDRFPVPGCLGGTYRRGNIRPACQPCNSSHGGGVRGLLPSAIFGDGVGLR